MTTGRRRRIAPLLASIALVGAAAGPPPAPGPAVAARQVTTFGVLATLDARAQAQADPALRDVEAKLRSLMPDYSFRRLGVASRRLSGGQALACDLGAGRSAKVALVSPLDDAGRVTLRFTLAIPGQPTFVDEIRTPPNQLVLVDRMLPSRQRLLIGLGAR